MACPNSPPSFVLLFIFLSTTIFNLFIVSADSDLLLGHKLVGGGGGRRSLMSFKEKATGSNITYECSPSGPCVYCLYSEKNDEKYRCSETGYRIPLKCVEIGTAADKGKSKKTNKKGRSAIENTNDKVRENIMLPEAKEQATLIKHRNLLEESSKTGGESEPYISYRSCIPAIDEEKLSVVGFEYGFCGQKTGTIWSYFELKGVKEGKTGAKHLKRRNQMQKSKIRPDPSIRPGRTSPIQEQISRRQRSDRGKEKIRSDQLDPAGPL